MEPKTAIITGANSGIGKAAAFKFAAAGHAVIMACRSPERSRPIQSEIIGKTANDKVFLEELDMASFESIRAFCRLYQTKYSELDILIHNAAYVSHGQPYQLSSDGIELTFATNVFGPFLMTMLLRDLLARSDDPRILHAGSNIIKHFFDPKKAIDFSDLQGESEDHSNHSVYISYRNSKMALLMLTFLLAKEFEQAGIKVNYLQINGAKLSKETLAKFTPRWRAIGRVQNMFLRRPEFMAGLYFDICTSDAFKEISGKAINHRLEIMQPEPAEKGFVMEIKQPLGADFYPAYAHREDVSNKLLQLCSNLCVPFNQNSPSEHKEPGILK